MDPWDWAKDRLRCTPQAQSYQRPNGQPGRTGRQLDENELRKLFTTLRRRGQAELGSVMAGLTGENARTGKPLSAFAFRSSNSYLGHFKTLQAHLMASLAPGSVDEQDAVCALGWLKRLLEIRKNHPTLLKWLMGEEQATGQLRERTQSASPRASGHQRFQSQPRSQRSERKKETP
jgi:hypothetical protein